jgi:hypothetical protein
MSTTRKDRDTMTQTINGLTSILGKADETYERGDAEIDTALERFAAAKAKLFREDGSAVYADQVYREKLAALTAELHAVAGRVVGGAEAQIATVNRLQEIEHADPIGSLTLDQQQQASARATFVREDAMLLTLDDLTRRLVGVGAAGKEKVDCYLWSRYARQRIEAERTQREDSGRPLDPTTRAQLASLIDAITDLEAAIGATPALTRVQATKRIHAARRFQAGVRDRVGDVDGAKEGMVRAMLRSGRYASLA